MKKRLTLILIVSMLVFTIPPVHGMYYSHHQYYHTFDVIQQIDNETDGVHPDITYHATIDQKSINNAIKIWKTWGVNLVQVKSNADFHIKFNYFCQAPYLGYYNEDTKLAVIFTYCDRQDFSEDTKTHIIAHEMGHALGWSHESDPPFMTWEYTIPS